MLPKSLGELSELPLAAWGRIGSTHQPRPCIAELGIQPLFRVS